MTNIYFIEEVYEGVKDLILTNKMNKGSYYFKTKL